MTRETPGIDVTRRRLLAGAAAVPAAALLAGTVPRTLAAPPARDATPAAIGHSPASPAQWAAALAAARPSTGLPFC
ncbi:MAG TPA: hypothetical protein VGM10_04885 [Actinocrinis sp.]|jgi:hypothetical protein